MNAVISETTRARQLGLGMQILKIIAAQVYFGNVPRSQTAQNGGTYSLKTNLTETYWSRQYLSIELKKVFNAHSNALKPPKKNIYDVRAIVCMCV